MKCSFVEEMVAIVERSVDCDAPKCKNGGRNGKIKIQGGRGRKKEEKRERERGKEKEGTEEEKKENLQINNVFRFVNLLLGRGENHRLKSLKTPHSTAHQYLDSRSFIDQ